LLVFGSCSSFQVGAALAMRLFPVLGAPGATLLRLGGAAVVLLAITRPRVRGWQRTQWQAVVLYGISIAGTNAFFYAALARLPLGTAVTIQFLGPLSLSAALSRRMRDLGWVLLAMTGVAILGLAESHRTAAGGALSLTGVAFALVSAAFWAMYILTGSRASSAVPGRGGLAVAMTAGALILVPFGAPGASHITGQPQHLIPLASGMAMMASVVPYSLELAAMRRVPKRVFGILLSLEPAIATTAGWLLLGQHVAPAALAAIIIVIAASTGSTLGDTNPQSAESAQQAERRLPCSNSASGASALRARWATAGPGFGGIAAARSRRADMTDSRSQAAASLSRSWRNRRRPERAELGRPGGQRPCGEHCGPRRSTRARRPSRSRRRRAPHGHGAGC
jgi:inner membrane transporter RhtA